MAKTDMPFNIDRPVPDTQRDPEWLQPVVTAYAWVLQIVLVVFVGICAWYVWRWLLSRTHKNARAEAVRDRFRRWLDRWMAYLSRVLSFLFGRREGREAIRLYGALLSWGRRSGLPNRISETPLAYGCRLKQHFSSMAPEIDLIVSVYNQRVYREVNCDSEQLRQARCALKRLRSPLLLLKRLKQWFVGA